MPIYEFVCEGCGNTFEQLTLRRDEEEAVCPKCGGKECHRVMSGFSCMGSTSQGAGLSSGCSPRGGFS